MSWPILISLPADLTVMTVGQHMPTSATLRSSEYILYNKTDGSASTGHHHQGSKRLFETEKQKVWISRMIAPKDLRVCTDEQEETRP